MILSCKKRFDSYRPETRAQKEVLKQMHIHAHPEAETHTHTHNRQTHRAASLHSQFNLSFSWVLQGDAHSRGVCVCVCVCVCVAVGLWRQTTFSVVQLSIHDEPTRGLTNKTTGTTSPDRNTWLYIFCALNLTSCETKSALKKAGARFCNTCTHTRKQGSAYSTVSSGRKQKILLHLQIQAWKKTHFQTSSCLLITNLIPYL